MGVAGKNKGGGNTIGLKKSKASLLPRASLASIESLTMPLVQEVVLLADFQCTECQKRVADIIARMNGETESVVVSVLEKKVTLTCTNPGTVTAKVPTRRVGAVCRKPLNKVAMIKRLFHSSYS